MNGWSLEEEARQAFELAPVYCGECRDYHLTRALLKASGHQLGPERDRALFAPMLRRFTPQGARVLIAGAADTGVLAITLDALREQTPRVTVADQCRTPLILCERFAAAEGIEIATAAADLVTAQLGTFDLIVGHVVLNFIAPDQRVAFLRNIAGMLAPEGTFLLAMTVRRPGPRRRRTNLEQVMSGLRERGVRLPGDGTLVTDALRRQVDPDRPRHERAETAATELLFQEAGLEIVGVLDTASNQPSRPDAPTPSRLYFALGRRKS